VKDSGSGHVGSTGRRPTICTGIVSAARVRITAAVLAAPHNHFGAGPHCRVIGSSGRRIGGAGSCPGVINASGPLRYCRKSVVSAWCCEPPGV
jgi:hypothetical protein